MHAAIKGSTAKKFVINSARRLGKSYLLCVIALEQAIQFPGSQIKYAASSQRAVKKIILPLMRQILETCPKHLRPVFKVHDGEYEFANGSLIAVAGSGQDQLDNLRGTACDLALIDEAGFIESDDLTYLIESILLPQTLTRPNARVIIASTPPVTPDHSFVTKYMADAMAKGAYSRFTIFDNPLLTQETIEEFMAEAGGATSTTWRREYLAEVVTETTHALFPEVADGVLMRELAIEVPRPSHIIPITVLDLGYLDFTGVLFGYYHFALAKIVIEDEFLINKATSADIVQQILAREKALWGDVPVRHRVADAPAIVIADLNQTHRFACRTPEKYDLSANVNRVRMEFQNKGIYIHPRCTGLIAQCQFGTWNTQHNGFSRSSSGGHWDLAAALVYLCKHIDKNTNPIPPGYGIDPYNTWGVPTKRLSQLAESLRPLFPRLRPDRGSRK